MLIGYARVSSDEQDLGVQVEQLTRIGCEKIYQDKASGKSAERQGLQQLLEFAREGDILHVTMVDRIARNTIDALGVAEQSSAWCAVIICHDLGEAILC